MTEEHIDNLTVPEQQELVRRLFAVRAQIQEIESGALKTLKAEKMAIERTLMGGMQLDTACTIKGVGNCRVYETLEPHTKDWSAVYQWIVQQYHELGDEAFYVLRKQINGAPFRDILNAGMEIPGVHAVPVRKVGVTRSK